MDSGCSSPISRPPPRKEDTIAAISTPFGESGIGIVRVSGPLAEPIAKKLFKPKRKEARLVSSCFHYGEIIDPTNHNPIDEVLLVLMEAPKTYTREDIVEIHCHGGYLILEKVLELTLRQGARLALPGEFTKRAFLNGRIDLTQAEAVIDVIKAKTEVSLKIANQQLKGWLHKEISQFKARLIEHLALIEAHIDFPEEEIGSISVNGMMYDVDGMVNKLDEWIGSYEEGKIFREGVSCAIIGKTNVGKSSLLNVLLREERAIVTPIPGTTRDVIEEVLNINGVPVRLIDMAGLRRSADSIEQEGVRRARERAADSDLILLVLDGSRSLDEDDTEIFEEIKGRRKVVVINKNDLGLKLNLDDIKAYLQRDPVVSISCLKNEGIENLKETIYTSLVRRSVISLPDEWVVSNIRHKAALAQARESLINTSTGLKERVSLEFIAFEIRSALEALKELVGETTNEDVLNQIFDQFCIGK